MSATAIVPVPASFAQRRDAVFVEVAGQPPLVRIVHALTAAGDVVVAAAAPLVGEVRETLAEHGVPGVKVVEAAPPGMRADCIVAGLRTLNGHPRGPVVLHDVAWPLIAGTTLDRVLSALRDGALAVLPVRPVTDSIKAVDAEGAVTATVDRAPLRTVQYPRGFDADLLARLVSAHATDAFDELDAVLSAGTAATFVEGDNDAMSVELPGDAGYLAAVIECGRRAPGE